MPSAFREIIRQLEKQKVAIDRAIAALQDVGDDAVESVEAERKTRPGRKRRRRTLSPEARKRISDAVKKRWAASKKATKKRPTRKSE